jgi:parallel beta-helix repeat protein
MRQKPVSAASSGLSRRAALLAACLITGAQATTYTITSNTMALTNDATCGFREALDAVNSGVAKWGCAAPSGSDIINLSTNTYTTPVPLYVIRSVSIRCPAGTCTIDAGSINGNLFSITETFTPDVAMYRLTLRQSSSNLNFISGVALYSGSATLDQTVINGFRHAGFFATNGWPSTLLGSTLSGNNIGISLEYSGEVTLHRNTISNNAEGLSQDNGSFARSDSNAFTGNGTGIRVSSGAIFSDHGSLISNNSGAGISVDQGGGINLVAVTISGNRNRGIYLDPLSGLSTVYYSTIDGNSTSGDGAGISLVSSGSGVTPVSEFFQTTFSNNKAGNNGGGAYISGTANLHNCTFSGNTAANGGGVYNFLASTNSYLKLIHCTIAFNQATVSGGGVVNVRGEGGDDVGIFQSIVARNSAPMHPDISGLNKGGESIFGDLTGSWGDHSDDFSSGDPLLGPLMDSPGRLKVKTHALLKGSPAINKITLVRQENYDGRGFPRLATENWDVGAYEAGPFQTESLTVISQSSDDHRMQNESGLSNGAGTVFRADAVGDFVTYAVAIPEPGTYDIALRIKAGANRPIVELATSPGTTTFTTIGSVDLYRSSLAYANRSAGSFTFSSAGIKHFRLKVTGRNVNSTGYLCYYDYINVTKQ